MAVSLAQLEAWMIDDEGERLEFKAARNNYQRDKLFKYCVALANEGGGHFILGVTDKKPRRVAGSNAFLNLATVKHELLDGLRLRIEADELNHADGGRVVVFSVPARPIGTPLQYDGVYWMRSGESLVAMTPDHLKRIFDEAMPDFSARICHGATIDDLDENAIVEFRERWISTSGREALRNLSHKQLLADAELVAGNGITYAALILFGTRQALGRHLAQCEVIFEYRSQEAAGPAQQREEYRQGYFLFLDEIWKIINLRNDLQHFYLNMTAYAVPTFDEKAVREAVLNAVSHRDYRAAGSVFVRQYARRLEVVSPGGLPAPVTPSTILSRQFPRNRRIAETFLRCGLVERAGQGFNLIFEQEIKQGKPLPGLIGTDEHQVFLTLHGEIEDTQFLRFLERLGDTRVSSFATEDLLALYQISRKYNVDEDLQPQLARLLQQGLVVQATSGKQTWYLITPRLYDIIERPVPIGLHRALTRLRQKETLLEYIVQRGETGSKLKDLMTLLPTLSRRQIQELLREMKGERLAYSLGQGAGGRWYPGAEGN